MSRPLSPLPPENIAAALAYLKRAAERNSQNAFLHSPATTRPALLELEATLLRAVALDRPPAFNQWVAANLTAGGRLRMLNALRRRRADARTAKASTHSALRLPAKTVRELKSISRQAGLSVALLLAAFAARVQADPSGCDQLRQAALSAETDFQG